MANMDIYNALCTPPNDALKPIQFGALKGKSDINPQWRYEALTQKFGPCGIGWYFTVEKWWTQEISTGETMVYAMVNLYIKDGDEWSKPIPGWGGDFLVKKDKNGIRGNDEAMKMAVTDALGTAAKMLGVAADVYRGLIVNGASDSKYSRRDDIAAQTSQNRAGDAKSKKPSVPMQGIQKGKDSEFLRGQALKKVQNVQMTTGITNEQVKAVISWKFGKSSWKDLGLDEACILADTLPKLVEEMTAA